MFWHSESFKCLPYIVFWFDYVRNSANHCSDTLSDSRDSYTWLFDLIMFQMQLIIVLTFCATQMILAHDFLIWLFALCITQTSLAHGVSSYVTISCCSECFMPRVDTYIIFQLVQCIFCIFNNIVLSRHHAEHPRNMSHRMFYSFICFIVIMWLLRVFLIIIHTFSVFHVLSDHFKLLPYMIFWFDYVPNAANHCSDIVNHPYDSCTCFFLIWSCSKYC